MDDIVEMAPNQCPFCGSKDTFHSFKNESFQLSIKSNSISIDNLSGDRCIKCDEVLLDDESQDIFSKQVDILVEKSKDK